MQINPNNNLTPLILPLPIYTATCIAEIVAADETLFNIFVGLDEAMVEQLKKLSLDKSDIELQKNTSDYRRFGTTPYEVWYSKNRTPFALIHVKTQELAALVWFGPEPLFSKESRWHTAGWRSYNPFRGKGIMKDFATFVLKTYENKVPGINIWIATAKNNTGSSKLAEALGFQELSQASDEDTLIMLK